MIAADAPTDEELSFLGRERPKVKARTRRAPWMPTWRCLIARVLRRYRHRDPWGFCWRITIERLAISLLAGSPLLIIAACTAGDVDLGDIEVPSLAEFIAVAWIAPVLETLLLQALPIELARRCKAGTTSQALASILPFWGLHAADRLLAGWAAGLAQYTHLVGGFYLAVSYIRWRRFGRWPAFWVTTFSHALGNAFAGLMLYLAG